MKKIFSIIMLCALSLAAVAQTTLTKPQAMKSLMAKQQLSRTIESTQIAPVAQAAEDLDTVEVYFNSFYQDPIYVPEEVVVSRNGDTVVVGGDWIISVVNERYQFNFDFYGGSPATPAGTYSIEDFEIDYSSCFHPEAPNKTSYYKSCDMTITEEILDDSYVKYILEADIVSTLGIGGEVNGIFKVYAEHTILRPTTKLDVAILDCVVEPEEDRFRIYGQNDTMDVDLTFFTETGVEGYYSHKLLDTEDYKLVHRGKSYEIVQLEGMLVSAETKTGGMAYVFMYEALTSDAILFNIAMEAPIVATDTINITCNNMQIDDTWGMSDATIIVTASNAEYDILAAYNDKTIKAPMVYPTGSSGVELTHLRSGKTIKAMQCNLSITGNIFQGYQVDIKMLGNDHKYYIMQLSYSVPEVQETVKLDFTAPSKAIYYIDEMGLKEVQIANYNGEYSVSFDILNIDQVMGGEFTKDELFEENTFLVHHTMVDDIVDEESVAIYEIDGKIWQKNDTTYLTSTIVGFDSIKYEISMYYAVPTPTDTIDIVFNEADVEFTNALPQGIFILNGATPYGEYTANLQVQHIQGENIQDTFVLDGVFDVNDFDAAKTNIQIWDATAKKYIEVLPQKGTLTITIDENNMLKAVGSFICDDAKQYNLTFYTEFTRVRLPYDNEYDDVEYTFEEGSYVETEDYREGYGMVYLGLQAHDKSAIASFYFYADEYDEEIGVPEGTYLINKTAQVGTAHPSTGIGQDGHPIEAFFCWMIYDEEEDAMYYDQEGLYCLVDGSITIKNVNGKISVVVDAVNSYDMSVKLYYNAESTAVENINIGNTNISKRLINGQLLIIRNGETYNANGAKL